MRNKSVAVLDIRSSEVCAAVAERGVNNTFIIKSKYTCSYDGYADGELLDIASFTSAVKKVVGNTVAASGEKFTRFYVGIPDEFLKVCVTEGGIALNPPQKVKPAHIHAVAESAQPSGENGWSVVERSPVYYSLSDKRRVIDPEGCFTESLRARISWFLCKNSFAGCVVEAFRSFGQMRLKFVPSSLAQSCYLIAPAQRDNIAVLLDIGYISSSLSVSCGNGVVYSRAFSVGTGHIAAFLMDELEIPYEVALQFMSRINLNAKDGFSSFTEVRYGDMLYSYSSSALRELIREGLDGICDLAVECMSGYTERDITGKTLYLTGEGAKAVRGTPEHISVRLGCPVNVVCPHIPYYDKPKFSSLFSLLDAALGDN